MQLADHETPFLSRLLPQHVKHRLHYYPRLREAVTYAQTNIDRGIRLDHVARHVGLVPCAFSRYFTEKVGMTFSSVWKIVRVERAIEHLERKDESLSELASRCGFRSYCAFARAFKDVVGETPSEYRRQVLGTLRSDAA